MRTHVEKSKKYELDKFIIKKIYNIKEKKKRVYKIQKKNVVYDKQLTEQYYKYSNNNRNNYYSSYQSFRDYISSGYNYDFLINEINNVKSILGFSRSIRDIINKKINKETSTHNTSSSFTNQNQIPELNEESYSNEKINIQNENTQKIKKNPFAKQQNPDNFRRASTVFQIDRENPYIKKMADLQHKNVKLDPNFQSNAKKPPGKKDFLEICKLLKIKEEEAKNPQNQYQFRLFSVLSEDYDPFYLPVYEKFMNVKYENQKTKLIKLYNQEKAFIECVTLIKNKLKSHLSTDKNMQHNNVAPGLIKQNIKGNGFHTFTQYKFQIKVPYINAFYLGRIDYYFKDIDNFMSMYKENISLASKQLEKDFFENLFKILTFNNSDGKKFLQYLYSHSYFFHYIYNIFTTQNKMAGMTIRNFAPSIKKHNEEEHFLNDSMKQLFFTEDSKNKSSEDNNLIINKLKSENNKINDEQIEDNINIDTLLGNDFIYQINLCEEEVSDYINTKNFDNIKKIITNNKKFNPNYIITLNNNENVLQIFIINNNNQKEKKKNDKNKKYLLSVYFDDNINFYDLENDVKNNIKILKDKKKPEKFILIGLKPKNEDFTQAYIFKLSSDIFTRLSKSISSKGKKIKKNELFGEEQEEEEKSDEKIKFEDIMKEAAANEQKSSSKGNVIDFSSNESNKNSEKKKKEKDSTDKENIKKTIRKDKKQYTFGLGAIYNFKKDNLNESDKNEENEDDEENKNEKSENRDSSDEVKLNGSEKDEDEEDEDEDEDEEEGKNESDEDEDNIKNENDGNGDKNENEEDEDNEDSKDKNDNNENETNKNDIKNDNIKESKDEGSKESDEDSDIMVKKINNEEEINTDIGKDMINNKNDKESDKSNSSYNY